MKSYFIYQPFHLLLPGDSILLSGLTYCLLPISSFTKSIPFEATKICEVEHVWEQIKVIPTSIQALVLLSQSIPFSNPTAVARAIPVCHK